MNVFPTDHPLVSEPSRALLRLPRRLLSGFLAVLVGYPLYMLLVGPDPAWNGTRRLDFLPQVLRDAPFYPAAPVCLVHGLRRTYDDYLHWWDRHPNKADPETGWY